MEHSRLQWIETSSDTTNLYTYSASLLTITHSTSFATRQEPDLLRKCTTPPSLLRFGQFTYPFQTMINTICCTWVFPIFWPNFHIIFSQISALYNTNLSNLALFWLIIYHEMKTPETSTEENYASIQVSLESKYFCKGNDGWLIIIKNQHWIKNHHLSRICISSHENFSMVKPFVISSWKVKQVVDVLFYLWNIDHF